MEELETKKTKTKGKKRSKQPNLLTNDFIIALKSKFPGPIGIGWL